MAFPLILQGTFVIADGLNAGLWSLPFKVKFKR
jgi:hypothetical protein